MPSWMKISPILLILLVAGIVFAVQISSLHLRVIDQNGDLLTNVVVKLKVGVKTIEQTKIEESKEVILLKLKPGKYVLEIEAQGFKSQSLEIEIKPGENDLIVKLDVADIVETVQVEKNAQEKSIDESFGGFFTRDQIEALPDDPKEIEQELKRRYGADTIIRVDGFTGRIPPKSRISSIKASLSSFDAENHELGYTYVDITTKVGKEAWSGDLGLNFNDESLNARNPFSLFRLPEQTRDVDLFLMGPIKKNRSSFWIWLGDNRKSKRENIIAVLPQGFVNNTADSRFVSNSIDANITQNLAQQHVAKFSYSFYQKNSENLGVGGFNLPERGFSQEIRQHQFRIYESGYVGKRFLNLFQLEFKSEFIKTTPQSEEKTTTVLDAFSTGGAGNASRNSRQSFWIADNLLFGVEKHALKIGGLLWFEKRTETSSFNQNGTFLFSSLNDFLANRPSLFTQNPELRKSEVSQAQIGAYVQDDIRIRKSFNLSLGLRYEWQNNLSDYGNFSPRLGFTWSPLKTGKMTFRGGAGIFYNWLETNTLSFIFNRGIEQPGETIVINPGFPNPAASGTSQVLQRSYWKKADNLQNPYIIHSSIGVESPLRKNLSFRANYIFQKGINQFRSRNINAPISALRPDADFGNIIQVESSAFFVRNSLNIGLNGNLRKNISFGVDYTLSKKISDGDGIFSLPSNNYNLKSDRSAANDDQRHRISTSIGWNVRKGMRLSAIYVANSPLPYTITTGKDENADTIFNDRPFGVLRNSERGKWRSQLDLGFSWTFSFVNRKGEFSGTSSVTVSSSEVNPGFGLTDSKKRFSLKFYATARNVLNQTNLTNFVGVQTSPYFRQAIATDNPRTINFGLRFNF